MRTFALIINTIAIVSSTLTIVFGLVNGDLLALRIAIPVLLFSVINVAGILNDDY